MADETTIECTGIQGLALLLLPGNDRLQALQVAPDRLDRRGLGREFLDDEPTLGELIEGIDLLTPDAPVPIEGSIMENAKKILEGTK